TSYYVPFEQRLQRIELDSGKADEWEWPPTENGGISKPGNLIVTSEQVVVVSDTAVAGFSKWETARDNRLAQIKEHPADPAAYLALAEVSFRTGHSDQAQENMKKSVDLANQGQANGQPVGETLNRLYNINLNFAEQLLKKEAAASRDQAR